MERCPNCGARHRGADICPRCGMELKRLLQIDTLVRRLEKTALQLLLERNPHTAEIILQHALKLQANPMARLLLGFTKHLKRQRSGMWTK